VFTWLVIHFFHEKKFDEFGITCWKILDIYLIALNQEHMKTLEALEGAAASLMWAIVKPYFYQHFFPMNSRVFERRTLDLAVFSSNFSAAKTEGNALINFINRKCGEFARLLHNQLLLGWFGIKGSIHWRERKSDLDDFGFVLDLTENFKLIFLLGLMKAIQDEDPTTRIESHDIASWQGSRRQLNFHVKSHAIEKFNDLTNEIWTNGYLTQFQIEKKTLIEDYVDFLQSYKVRAMQLYQELLCKTVDDISLMHVIRHFDENIPEEVRLKSQELACNKLNPFTLESRLVNLFQDEERWNFIKSWSEFF